MEVLIQYIINLPQLAVTWTIFFGAGIILFLVQVAKSGREFSFRDLYECCIPFDIAKSKSFHMDVFIYFFRKLTDFVFVIPGAFVFAAVSSGLLLLLGHVFVQYTPLPVDYWITSLSTCVMILTVEFSDYLTHYLQHKVPFLWELHKVHHSADFLNPLTSKRGHFLPLVFEGVISGAINGLPAGVLMFLFKFSLIEALALGAVASKLLTICTLDPLKHSHVPVGLGWFDQIFISPHMHQVHHSKVQAHWDKNFGTNLSIYDWLFGTGYKPAKGEKLEFGISGYSDASLQKFNTLFGAYVTPMKRSWKLLAKTMTALRTRISSKGSGDALAGENSPDVRLDHS